MRLARALVPLCALALAGCGPEAIGDSSTSAPGSGDAGTTGGAPASGGAPAAPDAGAGQGAPAQDIIVAHDIHADVLRASIVRAHDIHAKNASYRQLVPVGDKEDATGGARDDLDRKGTVETTEVHAHDIHVDTIEADTIYAHAVKAK